MSEKIKEEFERFRTKWVEHNKEDNLDPESIEICKICEQLHIKSLENIAKEIFSNLESNFKFGGRRTSSKGPVLLYIDEDDLTKLREKYITEGKD